MTTATKDVPDQLGRFGEFGRRFVPETLMRALEQLTDEYTRAAQDPEFQPPPPDSLREDLARHGSEVDSFEVGDREIHWRIRGRMSESPLFGGDLDRALRGIPNTSRNVNTLRRILARTGSS